VARAEQGAASAIMHIVQRTEHIADCVQFAVRHCAEKEQAAEYLLDRLRTLQTARSLAAYQWNAGAKGWRLGLPADCQLTMALFCRYLDDALCPAIKFSDRHFVETAPPIKLRKLAEKVPDVAICAVTDQGAAGSDHNVPYFFVVWNRRKYGAKVDALTAQQRPSSRSSLFGAIKKPKAFLAQSWSTGLNAAQSLNDSFERYLSDGKSSGQKKDVTVQSGDDDDDQWNPQRKRKGAKEAVEAWYAEPGSNNVFHTLSLFALFVQKCCDGKLGGISLRDQRCTLLDAIKK